MNSLDSFDVEGTGIKYYYNGGDDIPELSNRNTFIHTNHMITKHINDRSFLAFMPIDVRETNAYNEYQLRIFGILMDGRKVEVKIVDIKPFFDIPVPSIVNYESFERSVKLHIMNKYPAINYFIKTIEAYPLRYSREKIKYIRIATNTTSERTILLNHIKTFVTETCSNDFNHYYRKVARENRLALSSWVSIENYQVEAKPSLLCEYTFTVTIDNYKPLQKPKLLQHENILQDKTLVVAWDIETYSSNNTGELPVPENDEDNAFMLCLSVHWLHDYDALEKICIVDKDTEADPRWITIVCGNFINVIKAFAICWNRYKPDIFIGYNDSQYDWPFIVQKAIKFDLLPWMWEKMSVIQFKAQSTVNDIIKYHYNNGNDKRIKISADSDFSSKCLSVPGTVCLDALPCFMKLYPRLEMSKYDSLKHYLQDNNLPTKVDLPITKLWKYYNEGNPCDMRQIAYYCIIDTVSVQRLFVKRSIIFDYREISTLAYVSLADSHYYAGGMKVCNLLGSYAEEAGILVNMQVKDVGKSEKYPGAYVIDPDKGVTPNVERLKRLLTMEDENEAIEQFAHDRPVSCLDFASLYPSIIMTYNLSPEKIILNERDKKECEDLGYKLHEISFKLNDRQITAWSILHNNKEQDIGLFPKILIALFNKRKEMKRVLKEYSDKIEIYKLIKDSSGTTISTESVFNKISSEIYELEQDILHIPPGSSMIEEKNARIKRIGELKRQLDIIRSICIKTFDKDYLDLKFNKTCIDKKQNALKIYMNTFYGETGNRLSPFFLLELAGGVTSAGQTNIKYVQQYVTSKGYYVKYGDSIMPYTPITIKINNLITVTTIKMLSDYIDWKSYPEFKMFDTNRTNKEYGVIDDIYIWSTSGWTRIKKFIRHNTIKSIYRVHTHCGIVDVTEDHSLLKSDFTLIKPSECSHGTELLHSMPIIDYHNRENYITNKEAFLYGVFMGCGFINKAIWIIANTNYSLIVKCKKILERFEKREFIIKRYHTLYYLYSKNPMKKYSSMIIYNSVRVVPNTITNSKESVVSHFMAGLTTSVRYGYIFNRLNELLQVVFNLYETISTTDLILETIMKNKVINSFLYSYHQITTQMYVILLQSLGYEVMINMHQSIYIINYSKYIDNNNQTIKNISLLYKKYTGYVYDIETDEGTFHAGIGDLIVKNTDSLYITCPNHYFRECDIKYRSRDYSKEQFFTAMVNITLRVIAEFQHEINAMLEQQNGTKYLKMENEGCNYPCIFLGKKKYFAIQHLTDANFKSKDIYIKGLETIKQGKSQLEKNVGNRIMHILVSVNNEDMIIDVVKNVLKQMIQNNDWNFEDFIISGRWKPARNNIQNNTFMKRMDIRHEQEKRENNMRILKGLLPNPLQYQPLEPGERFNYVLVKDDVLYNLKGKKITVKTGNLMEYAHIAKQENMKIDVVYYLLNYVIGTCARFISSDKAFAPKDTSELTAKQDDEYRISEAKKMLTTYIKELSGISKEEIQSLGVISKQLFKGAIESIASNNKPCYQKIIKGPLKKILFEDDSNVIQLIMTSVESAAKTYYFDICRNLCECHGIHYLKGYDINDKVSVKNLYKYIHLYKIVKNQYNSDYKIRAYLNANIELIYSIMNEFENFIKNKSCVASNSPLEEFSIVWYTAISMQLHYLQISAYYDHLINLKYKHGHMVQKPDKQTIKKSINEYINTNI
jgi:DNA polymerase elongation subunit (family B)